jgi:APA family basic amino acid/polyamine antiporter
VPIISIVLSALLTVDLAWLAPTTSGIGILIVLTGVPAYFFWRKASHYAGVKGATDRRRAGS